MFHPSIPRRLMVGASASTAVSEQPVGVAALRSDLTFHSVCLWVMFWQNLTYSYSIHTVLKNIVFLHISYFVNSREPARKPERDGA